MQANGWAKRGAVCSRDARLAGVRRWARPYAGRVGGASCVGGARAQAFALSEAAASVIRNGRLTMAYRSRKSFKRTLTLRECGLPSPGGVEVPRKQ